MGYEILYIGDLTEGGTCRQRMRALERLGHRLTAIDVIPPEVRRKMALIPYRVLHKIVGPVDLSGANARVRAAAHRQEFDVAWLDRTLTILPDTLSVLRSRQRGCRIIGYSPDDMMNPGNQSRRFLRSLPLYDIYFTTKTYNVEELRTLGCRRVRFIGNAYDPETHKPFSVTQEDRAALGGTVGFIGQWETERAEMLCDLAESGVDVRVWGYTWERCKRRPARLRLENRALWSADYARAICAFNINLGFLRKVNRDQQTTRSIEIPACGAFMLAERTEEHLALFKDGKEAGFFEGGAELLDKVRYYSTHAEERRRIAAAGRARCIKSGYSNDERVRDMLHTAACLI